MGSAHTRWFQGSGTKIIRATHFNPKHLRTFFREDPLGIAVATLGLDPAVGAAFDGVFGRQDDRPVARDDGDDQAEEDLPGGQARPRIAVEDAVVVSEVPLPAQAHDPQGRTDGAVAGGQDRPDGQDLGLGPGAVGEQWYEGGQQGYDFRWRFHGSSPGAVARQPPSILVNDPLDLLAVWNSEDVFLPQLFHKLRGFSSFYRAFDTEALYITLGLGLEWARKPSRLSSSGKTAKPELAASVVSPLSAQLPSWESAEFSEAISFKSA